MVIRMKENLKFAFHIIFHPFDGFWDMKREGKGRLHIPLIFMALLILSNILSAQITGFLFNTKNQATVDIMFEIGKVLIVFLLFCVANWSVTTLMSGEGTFKDIVMTLGYACLPIIIIQLPVAVISNIATYSEEVYINAATVISWVWFFWLLFTGIMTVHQYSIGKMLFTIVLTAVAMAALIFVYLLFMSLFTQLVSFIFSIYKELVLRI